MTRGAFFLPKANNEARNVARMKLNWIYGNHKIDICSCEMWPTAQNKERKTNIPVLRIVNISSWYHIIIHLYWISILHCYSKSAWLLINLYLWSLINNRQEIKQTAMLNCENVLWKIMRRRWWSDSCRKFSINSLLRTSVFRKKFNKQILTNFIDLCSIEVDFALEKVREFAGLWCYWDLMLKEEKS